MKRTAHILWVLLRLVIAGAVLSFNINLWTIDAAKPAVAPSALDAIVDDIVDGAADDMQSLFPEGYVITHALTGFAWVDMALDSPRGSEAREHALTQARLMQSRIDTDKGRSIFPPTIKPRYGAFYRGYLAWLRGGILLADETDDSAEVAVFQADCEEIAAAFREASTPYLESYTDLAWPGDSVFMVASLALHDKLFEPRYAADVNRWVETAQRLADDDGLLPHWAQPHSGEVYQPTRGVSGVLMSRMAYEVSPELAAVQYRGTRELFITSHLGLIPGVLEYRAGHDGDGDVDSGPLILGISLSASVVGVAAARFHGDAAYAEPATVFLHAIGFPFSGRYGFGLLPVGEAFFAWSKSSRPWAGPPPQESEWDPIMVGGWRFVWHLLSLGLLAALFVGELRTLYGRRRRVGNPPT